MEYRVRKIKERAEIETCEKFAVRYYMWNSKMEPKAYGYLGYIEGTGFFAKLVCEEEEPKCTYQKDGDPVYKDSAMELFLAFPKKGEPVTNDVLYLNFEMNSAGALRAQYGRDRENRTFLSEELCADVGCRAKKAAGRWEVEFVVPEGLLNELDVLENVKNGEPFYLNFYKIAEDKEVEHYGSYMAIESEAPNFHLPIYFCKTRI